MRQLDEVARRETVDVFDESLQSALGNDPTVYVIRRISTRLRIPLRVINHLSVFAERWGRHLAAAAMHAIAGRLGEQTNIVKFAGQAEYVAQFVSDLLRGRTQDRWYYDAFRDVQHLPADRAACEVLLAHREHFPAVLRCLHENGGLPLLLQRIDERQLKRLWVEGLVGVDDITPSALLPLFETACKLMERLRLFHPQAEPRLQTAAGRSELFKTYLASGPVSPDWRDTRGLTAAVLEVVHFFMERNLLDTARIWADSADGIAAAAREPWPTQEDLPQPKSKPPLSEQTPARFLALRSRIDHEISSADDWDWLDAPWLGDQLFQMLSETRLDRFQGPRQLATAVSSPSDRLTLPSPSGRLIDPSQQLEPSRDDRKLSTAGRLKPHPRATAVGSLTQRQRNLLEDLASALQTKSLVIPLQPKFAPAWALRLYAALVAEAPRWADDPLATALIERLLKSLAELARSENTPQVLRSIEQGDLSGALTLVSGESRSSARAAFRFLVTVFKDVPKLRRVLETATQYSPRSSGEDSSPTPDSIETEAAGTFLLTRALMDAKATFWAAPLLGDEGFAALLAALALRWSGTPSGTHRKLDPGVRLFAGSSCPETRADVYLVLRAAPADWQRMMQEKLMEILTGQRLIDGEVAHLFWLPRSEERHQLVLGDASGHLWSFGRSFPKGRKPTATLLEWLHKLEEQSCNGGARVLADAALSSVTPSDVGAQFIAENDPAEGDVDVQRHVEGRRRLVQSLDALGTSEMESDIDLALSLAADALLRVWARWLRKFSDSSTAYLLENFVRRSGSVSTDGTGLHVKLQPKPLDAVLEMAGYFNSIDSVPWLENKQLYFGR